MNESVSQIYVVDDDVSAREGVGRLLRSAGLEVKTFPTAHEILASLQTELPSCLVLDVQLPDINGLELQRQLATKHLQVPIIFLTGYGDIPTSVRAMKAGAIEFLTKPFRDEELLSAVNQAIERGLQLDESKNKPAEEQSYPEDELRSKVRFSEIVGRSAALRQVLQEVELVAPSDATVLLLGETGTGKELIARAVHECSRRKEKPLIRVNCTSIPKDLFESEFFGHIKGAFTGAIRDRAGRFEAAAGGTLFLDEVGEIPLELQSKLLRVLQEKSYERVGEERTRRADVRIIAATNRDLKSEVAAGRFREDLYYRLNVFPLRIPVLSERKEDIALLATHFVESLVKELGCPKPRLTRAGIETLQGYDWPGNIRELRNVIERAVIIAAGGALEFDLPVTGSSVDLTSSGRQDDDAPEPEYLTESEMRRREQENLLSILEKTGWKIKGIDGAAEILGVKATTLVARIKKMGFKRPLETT
jgi:DNA-binding NtrC family response regulator